MNEKASWSCGKMKVKLIRWYNVLICNLKEYLRFLRERGNPKSLKEEMGLEPKGTVGDKISLLPVKVVRP